MEHTLRRRAVAGVAVGVGEGRGQDDEARAHQRDPSDRVAAKGVLHPRSPFELASDIAKSTCAFAKKSL